MLVSFAIYDAAGLPLVGAAPTFLRYVDAAGTAATAPSIAELGAGLYGFEVDDADTRAFHVDGGAAASPRYQVGSAGDQRFCAFGLYDNAGAPVSGATPSFATYCDADGVPLAPPPVLDFGDGLYGFTAGADNVAFLLTTGASPAQYGGAISVVIGDVTPPVVTHFDPVPGTPINATTPLSFRVTDNSGVLRRALLVVQFLGRGIVEVVHDGDHFSGNYLGTRAAIADGYQFSGVLRVGGWPSTPTLRAYVTDVAGNEAA